MPAIQLEMPRICRWRGLIWEICWKTTSMGVPFFSVRILKCAATQTKWVTRNNWTGKSVNTQHIPAEHRTAARWNSFPISTASLWFISSGICFLPCYRCECTVICSFPGYIFAVRMLAIRRKQILSNSICALFFGTQRQPEYFPCSMADRLIFLPKLNQFHVHTHTHMTHTVCMPQLLRVLTKYKHSLYCLAHGAWCRSESAKNLHVNFPISKIVSIVRMSIVDFGNGKIRYIPIQSLVFGIC